MKNVFSVSGKMATLLILAIGVFLSACHQRQPYQFHYSPPNWNAMTLEVNDDSLHFPLTENTYNNIRSFNIFSDNGLDYISFYDKLSLSVNIYQISTQQLVSRIDIRKCITTRSLEKHTTVFCKNLDTILVLNKLTLFIIGKNLKLVDSVKLRTEPIVAFSSLSGDTPPVFIGQKLYISAYPYLSTTDKKALKKWRSIYEFDLRTGESTLFEGLPEIYFKGFYGRGFVESSYCLNRDGKFVMSYGADSNLYVTDFRSYAHAYNAKSKYHEQLVSHATPAELKTEDGPQKAYLLRDSYGAIYFDRIREMYFRIAEKKITLAAYNQGERKKIKSLILLDKDFQIVGETTLPAGVSTNSIFFTSDGKMFARTHNQDEDTLHFVRVSIANIQDSSHNKLTTR
jgi:hypothetical protein